MTVKIEMGRFRAEVKLIVAELSVFDFIMGFDLIKRFKVRLDFDPLRLSGIGEGSSKYGVEVRYTHNSACGGHD